MGGNQITPDQTVYLQWGWVQLNATIVFTWGVMALMVIGSWLITRKLQVGPRVSRWQILLETVVGYMRSQIDQIAPHRPLQYLPFVGTLFLFIAVSNALMIFPGYLPPTASLSTEAALAICVFLAVPVYGALNEGVIGYLRHYIHPTPLMLPFHIVSELSRTLALAVRLFGNVMSGVKIGAILLVVIPFIFPVVMQLLGLLTGMIHAYIFAVLTMVYIASGMEAHQRTKENDEDADEAPGGPETPSAQSRSA